jgi:hypothetical protein
MIYNSFEIGITVTNKYFFCDGIKTDLMWGMLVDLK